MKKKNNKISKIVIKTLAIYGIVFFAIVGCVLGNNYIERKNSEPIGIAAYNEWLKENPLTVEALEEYIETKYNKQIEFDKSFSEINEIYSLYENKERPKELDEQYQINRNNDKDDDERKIAVLLALKDTLEEYTEEALNKMPEIFVINKNMNSINIGGVEGVTAFIGKPAIMFLYYYSDTPDYSFYSVYKGTIHHEIFHCLDLNMMTIDEKWDSIDEDCANISEYACTNSVEDRAETWKLMINNNKTPNEEKANYLMTEYGGYLNN